MAKIHRPVAPVEALRKPLLARAWGVAERHARAITFLCTAIIIIATIVVINFFWAQAKLRRAYQELDAWQSSQTHTVDDLLKLRDKYRDTRALPHIQFALANAYYREGKLNEAQREYEDFMKKYSDTHFLAGPLRHYQTRSTLERDLDWRKSDQHNYLRAVMLGTTPYARRDLNEPFGKRWPRAQERPRIKITTNQGDLIVELLEDEAPNATAHLLKLIGEKKTFDGARFSTINLDEALQANARTVDANYRMAFEPSARDTEAGQIILMPNAKGDEIQTGFIRILQKPVPELHKKVTVVGIITSPDVLMRLKRDDWIEKITVESKRSHPYEPVVIKDK